MLKNLCLLLVSCAIGLSLCEVSLRLFYPRYRNLAEAQFRNDALRLYARTPNGRGSFAHPDTHFTHSLHHNNFGLRQHRDFREADLAAAVNIGVFGDSFTENVFVAAPYSFTEPLDYLLNLQGDDQFNVLNFGVAGYGTGQSFLRYEDFHPRRDLDHVLYVYHRNDLKDNERRFRLDEAGRLALTRRRGVLVAPLVRNLHVTYLILDAFGRLAAGDAAHLSMAHDLIQGDLSREQQIALEVFRQLIRRWKNLVEDAGGTFSIVLTPVSPQSFVVDLIRAEGIEVIDLHACFNEVDPARSRTPWIESPYRFKNDWHWNETGNSLAAVCLYRALERKTGFPGLSEDGLQEAVSRYYAVFGGENFLAFGISRERAPSAPPREVSAEIRKKYMELDLQLDLQIMELVRHQSDRRVISSELDVYLAEDRLVYVKDKCRSTDADATVFLHVEPVDYEDLPGNRRQYGFETREIRPERSTRISDRQCAFTVELPDWPIRRFRTGQYVPGSGELWSAEVTGPGPGGGGGIQVGVRYLFEEDSRDE